MAGWMPSLVFLESHTPGGHGGRKRDIMAEKRKEMLLENSNAVLFVPTK
jgi:hypothetical protein